MSAVPVVPASGQMGPHPAPRDGGVSNPVEEAVYRLRERNWVVVDGAFGADVAAAALAEAEQLYMRGALAARGVGRGHERVVAADVRGDLALWLDPSTAPVALRAVVERLDSLRVCVNQTLLLNASGLELQLTRYDEGAHYDRHLDAFRGRSSRVVTCVYYLNPAWCPEHGGELRVYEHAAVDVAPIADRLILFLSEEVEHEVLPSHTPRYAISGWFRQRGAAPG